MPLVTVVGEATTTTSVALAAGWPSSSDVLLVEADSRGGDVAAWFDMPVSPSLSTLVTAVSEPSWATIERHTRVAPSGLRLIPAPSSGTEAQQAVSEASRWVVPVLASVASPVVVADAGDLIASPMNHPFVGAATTVVLVHRQATQSAGAAAVRLRRLIDQVESLSGSAARLMVAVVGSQPFDHDQIARSLGDDAVVIGLPLDPLAAAIYAGRTGVSARRLARLPLSRAAANLATVIDAALRSPIHSWSAGS